MIRRLLIALTALLLAPAAQAQDLARETAKVEDLRSIREIKNLQAVWGHMALAGHWKGMTGLVAEGTVLAEGLREHRGRAGIEEWLRETQGQGVDGMPAGRLNLRLYISPVITLAPDGQRATGRWHEIALTGEHGISADWLGVTHVIEYRKTPEGWRISGWRSYEHFAGPYEDGWTHQAETLQRAPYHYTPDEAGMLLPERRAAEPRALEDIEREATLLLEMSRATNLVSAFGYYLDRGMYDDIVELFFRGGSVFTSGQGPGRGLAEIRPFLEQFGRPGLEYGELNERLQLMPRIIISENATAASVATIEIGMTGAHGGEGQWSATRNIFALERGPDNIWRIFTVVRQPLMRASYQKGWAEPSGNEPQSRDEGRAGAELTDYPHREISFLQTDTDMVIEATSVEYPPAVNPNALALAEAFDGAENVSNAYGYYIDQFAWRDTAALFSRDGWKELSYIGTFVGKERVLGSLIQRYGEGGPNDAFQAIHQKTQPYVTVLEGGERAQIRTRLLQVNSSSTGPGSWISGIYENQVVKEDGVWRIHGMDLDYVWLGDYATGWTGIDPEASRRFAPTAEQLADFGPDAPLRGEAFAPYPRVAPLGFHYANPVSGREPALRLTWSAGYREGAEPE